MLWRQNLERSLEVDKASRYQEAQRAAAMESEQAMRTCLASVQSRIETVYTFAQRSSLRCLLHIVRLRHLGTAGTALLNWRLKARIGATGIPMRHCVITSLFLGFDRIVYYQNLGLFRRVLRVWQARSWSHTTTPPIKSIQTQLIIPTETKLTQEDSVALDTTRSPSLTKRRPLSPVKSPVKPPVKSPVRSSQKRTLLDDVNKVLPSGPGPAPVLKPAPKTAAERVKQQADVISKLLTTSARPLGRNTAPIR